MTQESPSSFKHTNQRRHTQTAQTMHSRTHTMISFFIHHAHVLHSRTTLLWLTCIHLNIYRVLVVCLRHQASDHMFCICTVRSRDRRDGSCHVIIPNNLKITVERNCQLAVELRFAALPCCGSSLAAPVSLKSPLGPAYERFISPVLVKFVLKLWTRSSGQYKLSVFANLDGGQFIGTGRLSICLTNWWLI